MPDPLHGYDKHDTYFSHPRPEMLPFVPMGASRLLDVGCGTGNFGALVKRERGLEVWGQELTPASAAAARQQLDHVLCGDITAQLDELPDAHFDVITFNDVLEHLADPGDLLARIGGKLRPGGVVVSSMPNMRYYRVLLALLYGKDWKYEAEGIMDKTHLRFFTRRSMRRLFEEAGYEVLRQQGLYRTKSWRPRLYQLLTFGAFGADTHYAQYATVARLRA